jgi:hypothetical protein
MIASSARRPLRRTRVDSPSSGRVRCGPRIAVSPSTSSTTSDGSSSMRTSSSSARPSRLDDRDCLGLTDRNAHALGHDVDRGQRSGQALARVVLLVDLAHRPDGRAHPRHSGYQTASPIARTVRRSLYGAAAGSARQQVAQGPGDLGGRFLGHEVALADGLVVQARGPGTPEAAASKPSAAPQACWTHRDRHRQNPASARWLPAACGSRAAGRVRRLDEALRDAGLEEDR